MLHWFWYFVLVDFLAVANQSVTANCLLLRLCRPAIAKRKKKRVFFALVFCTKTPIQFEIVRFYCEIFMTFAQMPSHRKTGTFSCTPEIKMKQNEIGFMLCVCLAFFQLDLFISRPGIVSDSNNHKNKLFTLYCLPDCRLFAILRWIGRSADVCRMFNDYRLDHCNGYGNAHFT